MIKVIYASFIILFAIFLLSGCSKKPVDKAVTYPFTEWFITNTISSSDYKTITKHGVVHLDDNFTKPIKDVHCLWKCKCGNMCEVQGSEDDEQIYYCSQCGKKAVFMPEMVQGMYPSMIKQK